MAAFGITTLDFVIPTGATGLSQALQLNGRHVESILMPATWVAAGLSFAVCETSDGTFLPLVDVTNTEITLTVVASKRIMMPVGLIRGINWLMLQSGTSAAQVDQTASRTITLFNRNYL